MSSRTSDQALRPLMGRVVFAWVFGATWFSILAGAPLVRFGNALQLSELSWGLINALPFAATLLSIPASILIDRTGRVKSMFMFAGYLQRLAWLTLSILPGVLILGFGVKPSTVGVWIFVPLICVVSLATAIGIPAWISWMSILVPARIRGRYFAERARWGIIAAVPISLLAGILLDYFAPAVANASAAGEIAANTFGPAERTTLIVCSLLFVGFGILGLIDILIYQTIPLARTIPIQTQKVGVMSNLLSTLKNQRFVVFTLAAAVVSLATAPMGLFTTRFVVERLSVGSLQVQIMLVVLPMVAQFLAYPIIGRWADRHGIRPLVIMGAVGLVPVGLGWVFVSQELIWLGYILSVSGILLGTMLDVAGLNLLLEVSGSRNQKGSKDTRVGTAVATPASVFVSVNHVIVNVGGIVGSLAAAYLLQQTKGMVWDGPGALPKLTDFHLLFIASAGLRLAAALVVLALLRKRS